MIDRLRLGYVVDWVDIGIGDLRCYTFNVADAAISASILLLLLIASWPLLAGRGERRRRRRAPRPASRSMPEAAVVAGIRTVRVPGRAAGRVDRFVADATGLSRSHVQRLITEAG